MHSRIAWAALVAAACHSTPAAAPVGNAASPVVVAPLAIALVFEATPAWTVDGLSPLQIGFAQGARQLPAGTVAAAIGYALHATVVAPMQPADKLPSLHEGAADGQDAASGIALGLDTLEHTQSDRKVLIVVGDGRGDRAALEAAAKRAVAAKVAMFSIVYVSPTGEPGNDVAVAISHSQTVNAGAGLIAALTALLGQVSHAP